MLFFPGALEEEMILVVFAIVAAVGQTLNVLLCLALDRIFSPTVGAFAFVLLYMLVFAGAWLLAVRIVEGRHETWRSAAAR
jgi:hypothetical protein